MLQPFLRIFNRKILFGYFNLFAYKREEFHTEFLISKELKVMQVSFEVVGIKKMSKNYKYLHLNHPNRVVYI